MSKHTTYMVATGSDRGDREARFIRYATEADFRDQFGDIIESKERRAVAAGEYFVVEFLTDQKFQGGRRQTIHCTAVRSERPRLSDSLVRALRTCRDGKEASLQKSGMTFACLCGMLFERGLVQEIKHRDHTITYTPTDLGLDALRRAEQAGA